MGVMENSKQAFIWPFWRETFLSVYHFCLMKTGWCENQWLSTFWEKMLMVISCKFFYVCLNMFLCLTIWQSVCVNVCFCRVGDCAVWLLPGWGRVRLSSRSGGAGQKEARPTGLLLTHLFRRPGEILPGSAVQSAGKDIHRGPLFWQE